MEWFEIIQAVGVIVAVIISITSMVWKRGVKDAEINQSIYGISELRERIAELSRDNRVLVKQVTLNQSEIQYLKELRKEMLLILENIQRRMLEDG